MEHDIAILGGAIIINGVGYSIKDIDHNVIADTFNFAITESTVGHSIIAQKRIEIFKAIIEDKLKRNKSISFNFSFSEQYDKCIRCDGLGFDYAPMFDSIMQPCESCRGTGIHTDVCKKCMNLSDVEKKSCKICNGSGIYIYRKNRAREKEYKCRICQGKGMTPFVFETKKIEVKHECPSCKGLGIHLKSASLKSPIAIGDTLNKLHELKKMLK